MFPFACRLLKGTGIFLVYTEHNELSISIIKMILHSGVAKFKLNLFWQITLVATIICFKSKNSIVAIFFFFGFPACPPPINPQSHYLNTVHQQTLMSSMMIDVDRNTNDPVRHAIKNKGEHPLNSPLEDNISISIVQIQL